MTRKEELLQIARSARAELLEIEAQEAEEHNRHLVGKCFRFRNSYSCPETPADYWWMYARVISVDGAAVRMWRFQTDKDGKIEIEPQAIIGAITNSYQEIQPEEFQTAWLVMLERLERL